MKNYLGMAVGIAGIVGASLAAAPAGIVVRLDGQPVEFEGTQPRVLHGFLVVPVRGIFEQIGAYVEFNPVMHRIVVHHENEQIELQIDNKIARKNGAEIMLEQPPVVIHGSTMVPLRFIAESLGAKVQYDAAARTVDITRPPL